MKLKKLYSLRNNFTVIGLTGRVGSGCSEVAKRLSLDDFNEKISYLKINGDTSVPEELKLNICCEFISKTDNWEKFQIINYKDVLLFHLIFESIKINYTCSEDAAKEVVRIICQNGENSINGKNNKKGGYTNRYDQIIDISLITQIENFLLEDTNWFSVLKDFINQIEKESTELSIHSFLENLRTNEAFLKYYYVYFKDFSSNFYKILNAYNLTKRTRLCHDLANQLRKFGTVENYEGTPLEGDNSLEHIYTVAETINKLIKIWRFHNINHTTKIVIDSLKNSLELLYFKEKYSAFYMIAVNKSEKERYEYLQLKLNSYVKDERENDHDHYAEIVKLDNAEYDGGDAKKGEFSPPDIENCIQKSDYHIFFSEKEVGQLENNEAYKKVLANATSKNQSEIHVSEEYNYLNLDRQLVKLIALIHQPGIITPTAVERTMQVAYNAKYNSGCISRQVGAVVTDENFSIKAVGWNDVPKNQIPCSLRNANDLISESNKTHFSDFEKGIVGNSNAYKDQKTFKEKFRDEIAKIDQSNLQGRHCSFCFKSFHNAFEGEKNQVHTRSLHAEENAMMQIVKYGGQSLENGNLFTTASPCELCSKKAFQLGIKKVFYIDPYPGIATMHTLNSGVLSKNNPQLIMFQGAVGRTFHKLYEPFMPYKDELHILTKMNPKIEQDQIIKQITSDKDLQEQIADLIKRFNTKSSES